MKILLINPPNIIQTKSVLPEAIEEERGFNPPLGLLYLAGYIQKHSPQHKLMIIDCLAHQLNFEQIKQKIINFSPDIIGISVMTFNLLNVIEINKIIKKINKNIKIVLGGPHVNIYPRETLDLGNVDYIVLGEGEIIFNDLANNLKNEEKLKQITGLVFYDKNKNYIHTGKPALIKNLDALPLPARNLIDNSKYSSVLGTNKSITTMITSRGCPYKCLFCDRPHLGKIFRARSADSVIEEIKDCFQYGVKEFLVYDDTFTIDRQRVFDICDKIIEENLDITWDIRARVNTVDEEMLKKLKQAGCARIHYGVESGTQKILNILRKGITIEQVKKAFTMTKKAGIETLAYFMIGNPEETKEDIEKTIKFMREIDPDYAHITATVPFPATDLYTMALERKIIKRNIWLEFAKNPDKNFKPPLWEENANADELHNCIKKAYRNFYFRPNYIIKRLLALKSFNELKTKAKAGFKMLRI